MKFRLVLMAATLLPLRATADVTETAIASPNGPAPALIRPHHHRGPATLENRVQTLSTALGLNELQRQKLRTILEQQRAQVATIWENSATPAASRVAATKSVENHTADAIRAMLTEDQRKRFNPPNPGQASQPDPAARTSEQWIDSVQGKGMPAPGKSN